MSDFPASMERGEDPALPVVWPEQISATAREAIRLAFNPSGNATVNRLKTIAAVFITECEKIRDNGYDWNKSRNAALAITYMEDASMRAVLAATTGL